MDTLTMKARPAEFGDIQYTEIHRECGQFRQHLISMVTVLHMGRHYLMDGCSPEHQILSRAVAYF